MSVRPAGRNRWIGAMAGTITHVAPFLCALLMLARATAETPTTPAGNPEIAAATEAPSNNAAARSMQKLLDAPLLFVKRHSYTGIHIYDTYYKWPPGGGGIYVIENPAAPREQRKIRPVIDPTTSDTLGVGVYSHPELSWDAKRLLFCFKGEPNGSTSIYEIGIDGAGLRRLTDPTPYCDCHKGSRGGQHDVAPAYLPDGRIAFLSTRPSGLVPCNNTGVAILHVMNADGSDIHAVSVNNVNEFDPVLLPDGRILIGRWEYVDKNALTIQSLWTMNPDGTQETAFYANNMVFPEAILDARPIPGSHLIVGTFAKHNSTPRGSIGLVDPRRGKNGPQAVVNLEHPDDPTFDRGESCEPWPVNDRVFLYSGRPEGAERNVLQMINRDGNRFVLHEDAEICLHSPMLVKPRPCPPAIPVMTDRKQRTGRFFVQDVYRGLDGVERGEVKWIRVLEETSRISPRSGGRSPYNQTFLISSALAFSAKNFLGVVPVEEDGSAYFEAPAGKALYLQALDSDGRIVQSMRTFVQAAPGTTRSCIGCHEYKYSTTDAIDFSRALADRAPEQIRPESWGTGPVDYPSMVQPVLDKHCVSCHGGEVGIAAGMDLSGGWTEHFNISYENLTNRCETQLVAYWISGIDCMNGTALWSAQRFPPRSHGSGAAPLAELLVEGHGGRLENLSRAERDLLMAWIDSNGVYYGTWDYTENGAALTNWEQAKQELVGQMDAAGCLACHGKNGKITYFENDWINLKQPERSRLLRAPLAAGGDGMGLAWCRQRQVTPDRQRVHLLWRGYAHAVQPPEHFPKVPRVVPDRSGEPVIRFASTEDPHYQAMLETIRQARRVALSAPRVDMPGAPVQPGECRQLYPPLVPEEPLPLRSRLLADGLVELTWERSARTWGLEAEIHRGDQPGFRPTEETLMSRTGLFRYVDESATTGLQHYALVMCSGQQRGKPSYASAEVPPPQVPPAPEKLVALPASCSVRLQWQPPTCEPTLAYEIYRAAKGSNDFEKLSTEPIRVTRYVDSMVDVGKQYVYHVRAVTRRQAQSEPSTALHAVVTRIEEPVFSLDMKKQPLGHLLEGVTTVGRRLGDARLADGQLQIGKHGWLAFDHLPQVDLHQPLSVELWVRFDEPGQMPVVVGCGEWSNAGWFLQRIGGRWRWHVGGVNCDGGRPAIGRWLHVVGLWDGKNLRLYQDGQLVCEQAGPIETAVWPGEFVVGQYAASLRPEYQTIGRIAGLKIYHRPLAESEILESAGNPPE